MTAPPHRTGDLAGPGARAVVVGTSVHGAGSRLPDLPSVEASARDLARALHEICGMEPSQVELLLDPADGATVVEAVEQAAADTRGLVLFAFIGHGLLGPQDQLYLATATSSSQGIARSIPYQVIRDTLGNSGARVVVLLDCCFSGMAQAASRGPARHPYVTARPDGSFLLTSASNYAVSFAPEGERHTLFTGKLLELLHEGDPSAPAWLTLDGVYAHLDRRFQDGPVRPHRQSEDRAGELVVAPNRAYVAARVPTSEPAHPADGTACPYPGMEPFRTEDHERFFGREGLVEDLISEVAGSAQPTGAAEAAAPAPVVLVGASGVGKSSILRAGLLAGLERRYESDPATPWPALLLASPGPHPLRALADLWSRASGTPRAEVERQLGEGRLPGDGACRVLVVDQFEEVFTACEDADERARFIRALCRGATAAADGGGPRVVLGLRADHYGSCLEHPELRPALSRQWNVWPMDEDALRAAIEHPARDAGLRLETGLVELLLRDTREGGGRDHGSALPFLAHALRETWMRRSGATLTLSGYAATGGIWESVARTAEDIYEGFDQPGREAVRDLVLAMVALTGGGEEAVRRRIRLDELLEDRSGARRRTVTGVRDRLAQARLVTVDQTTAQISHEALLRAWPRLRRWIEEDRAGLVTRQQLTDAADAWHRAGRSPEYCYRGTRLVAADDWLREQRHARLVRPLDREFLAASQELHRSERQRERHQLEKEKRRTRELREALEREHRQAKTLRQAGVRLRRQARRLKQFAGVIGGILCLALVAAGVALQQRSNARANGEQAQNRQLQAAARAGVGTDPRAALLLAVAAYREAPSSQTRDTLMDVLSGTQYAGSLDAGGAVASMAYSDDGRTLAVGEFDGVVGLWDASPTGGEPRKLAEVVAKKPGILGKTALWIGDGTSLLLTGADDEKSVGAFSLAPDRGRPQPRGRYALPMEGFVEQVEFSPDGRLLMTSSSYDTRLWSVDPARGAVRARATLPQRESNVRAAAFGPGGALLALAWQDGTAELWDVADPGRPRSLGTLEGTGRPALAMAVSADGNTLAIGSGDAQVRLWDVSEAAGRGLAAADRRPTAVVSGHGGPVGAVALSRDGRRLALGSTDHSATVWDLSGGRPARSAVLSGHASTVSALAFTPDGRTLATGDTDGDVRFWSLTDRLLPTVTARPFALPTSDYYRWLESVAPYALSPDGRLLAVATADDQLGLIPLTGPSVGRRAGAVRLGADGKFAYTALWFSTDGGRLAAEGPAGVLTVWNVKDPARPKQEFRVRAGPAGPMHKLRVSIRDDLMATGSEAGAALWDLSRPGRPERLGFLKREWKKVPDVLLAPDDPVLAVDGALYDVGDPRKPDRLSALPSTDGSHHFPTPHAFSPDGTRLVVTDFGRKGSFLYDVSDPARPRFQSHLPQSSEAGPYAFSADGRLLMGSGSGTRLLAWDVWEPTAPHPVTAFTLDDQARALGISSDGATLTTYNHPGEAVRWNIAQLGATLRDPVARACRLAAANPTLAEWERMAPGVPFRRVCPTLTPAPSPPPKDALPHFPVRPTPLPAGK
ncbi:caspase family protein [Streptomyces sp. DH12]|uniref:caspase, EACC1-associated type n=1 Tax=Streptomyces sp. DH12 TaxID=2857010 RepID=UPI001E508076|nr:caspase family protein [Streptomyces sp. DH12]